MMKVRFFVVLLLLASAADSRSVLGLEPDKESLQEKRVRERSLFDLFYVRYMREW